MCSSDLSIQGQARSGEGSLKLRGQLTPDWPPRLNGHFVLRGQDFRLVKRPNLSLWVSPDLRLSMASWADPKTNHLDGELVIEQGKWTLDSRKPSPVEVSSDQVIVTSGAGHDGSNGSNGSNDAGESKPKRQDAVATTVARAGVGTDTAGRLVRANEDDGRPLRTQIELRLGDSVYFEGHGLLTRVAGQLRLTHDVSGLTLAEGVLRLVDGHYTAYGQDLEIQEGRLIFQGPVDNPAVDALAAREIQSHDVIVGIKIGGDVRQLESELFSLPELPEPEILAFLLTGRPLDAGSQAEAFVLIEAVAQLGIAGGDFIADEIAKQFGLDELRLEAGEELRQTSLAIGKYLTPNIYVGYTHSLFDDAASLLLEYAFSKHLRLEARGAERESIDLIYRVEH